MKMVFAMIFACVLRDFVPRNRCLRSSVAGPLRADCWNVGKGLSFVVFDKRNTLQFDFVFAF
jgi:hypothetical protein